MSFKQNIPVRITSSSRSRHPAYDKNRANFLTTLSEFIPVRITPPSQRSKQDSVTCVSTNAYFRTLVQCLTENKRRARRSRIAKIPSLLLSNVRSLSNKLDEVGSRISRSKPDIVVLTESWLDELVPDSSVSLPAYSVARKDRNKFGGGILIYISVAFQFHILDIHSVSTIDSCDSEILPVLFPSLELVLITVYHPFWNDSTRNIQTISTICDIIEHVFSLSTFEPSSTKIIVCGDFNDLACQLEDLETVTGLSRIVFENTRGNRILDQILTNIKSENVPSVSAPFGRSDHAVVLYRILLLPAFLLS